MELTVEMLRDAEFREGWRGYNPADVDEFIDRVSVGVQGLHDRIHELTIRAERAESRLGGENDDTVKRTLVLAQRAADLVVSEAKSVAERIVSDAHREAERLSADSVASVTAKRDQAERELAQIVADRHRVADAEHQRIVTMFRSEEESASRDATLARARSEEMSAQANALRDRFRAALTDQLVRLDHLVDVLHQDAPRPSSWGSGAGEPESGTSVNTTASGTHFAASSADSFVGDSTTFDNTSLGNSSGDTQGDSLPIGPDDLPVFGVGRHTAAGGPVGTPDDFMS